jgi:hypothetical protein
MKSSTISAICLALMILIALASCRPMQLHPVGALDRWIDQVSSQNNLGRTLHAAVIASESGR